MRIEKLIPGDCRYKKKAVPANGQENPADRDQSSVVPSGPARYSFTLP